MTKLPASAKLNIMKYQKTCVMCSADFRTNYKRKVTCCSECSQAYNREKIRKSSGKTTKKSCNDQKNTAVRMKNMFLLGHYGLNSK